jgi:hypothetical protein
MISPNISQQKRSYNRKLQNTRYKGWLKRLENDTSALRRSYDRKYPGDPLEIERDDIEYYRSIEVKSLKKIRRLLNRETRHELMGEHTFKINNVMIDFNKVPLQYVGVLVEASNLSKYIEKLIDIFVEDEEIYYDMRDKIHSILHISFIPNYDNRPYEFIEYTENLELLKVAFESYIEQFSTTYYHYKEKFERAHEIKRHHLLTPIHKAVVNNTLFLYILVHGHIHYEREINTFESPIRVVQLLHATPGCVFFSSGKESELYDRINLYVGNHKTKDDMIEKVIQSTLPAMSKLNRKVLKRTLKKDRSIQYVSNYIDLYREHPYVYDTLPEERIEDKYFSFSLNVNPLHITKNENIEGLKVIYSKDIKTTIDLVDYLELTINGDNEIVFTMKDIIDLISEKVNNLVIIDASCQSSYFSATKTKSNYKKFKRRLTKSHL